MFAIGHSMSWHVCMLKLTNLGKFSTPYEPNIKTECSFLGSYLTYGYEELKVSHPGA
jgi:hypothetical protein